MPGSSFKHGKTRAQKRNDTVAHKNILPRLLKTAVSSLSFSETDPKKSTTQAVFGKQLLPS